MTRKTLTLALAASFSFAALACDPGDQDQGQELAPATAEPVVIDAVDLAAALAEDPSTRIVVDLTTHPAGYTFDQSDAPMAWDALLWEDGSFDEPVDFETMSAKRGIDLDTEIFSIRPYADEGFRQACGTFPEEQEDLHCELDEWGWVCCSEPGGLG